MNNKIATGIWLVFIGIVILLHNTGVFHFNFWIWKDYWPLALVAVGISLLLQNRRNGMLISTVCNVAICVFLLIMGISTKNSHRTTTRYQSDYILEEGSQSASLKMPDSISQAQLTISGGAAAYKMISLKDSSNLIEASSRNPMMSIELDGDDKGKYTFRTTTEASPSEENTATINYALSTRPIWDLNLEIGAVNFKGDFSKHNLSALAINAGAANIQLKLGKPIKKDQVIDINTAASKITISIPKESAYTVTSKNFMSSNKFQGAHKIKKGHYSTDSYKDANASYMIQINGAANNFSVNTY